MGKVIRASALILLFACSAQAGWMGNESPAPASAVQEPITDGEVHTPGAAASLTQIVLDLLAALPLLH